MDRGSGRSDRDKPRPGTVSSEQNQMTRNFIGIKPVEELLNLLFFFL